ncbi:MAG: hypothetical protein US49_C0007G0022 [candidate division TM6 bacterium GW2011_GWF2_37_49]|nr:MAG: hypothetical protein US49_C0007G0022 [candidate division TM6 bacterium GW2011_GWF2_37_49]
MNEAVVSKLSNEFQAKYHKSFRWAFIGSLIYEITKTLHNFFLVKLMIPQDYGIISSCLAFTYFLTKLADLGASTSLLPFFGLIVQSKQNFKNLIFNHYLLPHLPLTFFIVLATTFLLRQTNIPQAISWNMLCLIALIVIIETVRSFLRLFMYTALQTKAVACLEVSTYLGFVLSVWTPYLILKMPLSFKSVLMPHLIESTASVIILTIFLIQFYRKLPSKHQSVPSNISTRMFKTKALNYILRLSREFFSTHFLTPFFAFRFGLEYAGIFYFSSVIAHSIQSIFKVSVGYMGNALFATLKNESSSDKQLAFSILCHKMSRIIIPITIFLLINLNKLLKLARVKDISKIALILPLLFLFILIIDFTMSLYEQLYVAEEKTENFLGFKIFEFLLFIALIKFTSAQTPISIFLVGIILIKTLCFMLISLNAFKIWKVTPKFNASIRQITIYVVISLFLSLAL